MKTCQTCNQNKAEWYALEPAEEFECRACFIRRTLWSQVIKNPNALDPALDPDPNTAARYSENDMRALRERLALLETAINDAAPKLESAISAIESIARSNIGAGNGSLCGSLLTMTDAIQSTIDTLRDNVAAIEPHVPGQGADLSGWRNQAYERIDRTWEG